MRTPDPSRLFLVAYDFPPIDSAGMQRIVSMAKYLSRRGWKVVVVTVKSSFVPRQSQASLDLIPDGVDVIRTPCFELRQAIARLHRWAYGDDADAFGPGASVSNTRGRLVAPLVKVLSALDNWTGFPDKKVGWTLPLFLALWKRVRRDGTDVVLSSSPPHSCHLPVLWLRRLRRFRWVVDFRDPWSTPLEGRRESRKLRRYRRLEGRILRVADAVVANTPGNRSAILETFPDVDADKVTVITNGFDAERAARQNGSYPADVGDDIVYTGFVYPGMLDTYIGAVRHLLEKGERPPRLQIFGPRPADLRLEPALDPYVLVHDSVPYEECLAIMERARALLLLVPYERETCVPSKLYAYLFSSTPILALGPPGDAADIIEQSGRGRFIRSIDPAHVAAGLIAFLEEAGDRATSQGNTAGAVEQYAWNQLSARLDEVLHLNPAA
jgi:glycosyltransferase involved in cell wall biosynthesis